MSNDTNWKAIREERQALVERIRALPFDAAWQKVREALEASPSLYTDNRVLTVYEGPTRSFLLPLPFELLQGFIQHRGAQAIDTIFGHTADPNPLVAGYCLHALSEAGDPRLVDAAARVAGRSERIQTIYGCFGWEGTLAEYGRKLHDEYIQTLEQERSHKPYIMTSENKGGISDEEKGKIIRIHNEAFAEFTRDGRVSTIGCDKCSSLIEFTTLSPTAWKSSCSCGRYNCTMKGL